MYIKRPPQISVRRGSGWSKWMAPPVMLCNRLIETLLTDPRIESTDSTDSTDSMYLPGKVSSYLVSTTQSTKHVLIP